MADLERESGSYTPISRDEVEAYSAEWRQTALEYAAADAYDIALTLERIHGKDPEFEGLDEYEKGVLLGELEARAAWLTDLLRKAKIVRHQNDESVPARKIEDVRSALLE